MPVISNEEAKKIKEIIEENERLKKTLKKENLGSLSLRKLQGLAKIEIANLDKFYGPVEAYAVEFVKIVKRQMADNNTKILFFNWRYFQDYVTKRCLDKNGKNQIILKASFREKVRDYGFCFRLERYTGTISVKKCEPRKRTT